jgi:hypothetical protein
MANVTITDLPPLVAMSDAAVMPVVANNVTSQITGSALRTYFTGGTAVGQLANGTSNVRIFQNGNVTVSVSGTPNVATFTTTDFRTANIVLTGTLTAPSANISNITYTRLLGNTVKIGDNSGGTTQGINAIAIGSNAAINQQGFQAIAIGVNAGNSTQCANAVAIGPLAGANTQGTGAVAVGICSGFASQGACAVGVGAFAGQTTQGLAAVAVGIGAGCLNQATGAVAVGRTAGGNNQSTNSVAIGAFAGRNNQGTAAIALGACTGVSNQANNSIIINATGTVLNTSTANSLTIDPIRNDANNTTNALYYNTTTKEVTWGPGGVGGYANSNVAAYLNSGLDGNIMPNANATYSLGNSTRQWKELWVSGSTIFLGGLPLSTGNGQLLVNGDPIITANSNVIINTTANIETSEDIIANNITANTLLVAPTASLDTITANSHIYANLITGINESVTISAAGTDKNIVLVPTGNGVVSVSSKRLTDLAEPVGATDATTKAYVDSIAEGLSIKESVDAATTTDLVTASGGTVTYNNGTSGVGATLTTTGAYGDIDGYTLQLGDRLLVKNETNQAWNGIYVVTSSTVLTRSTDFDTTAEIAAGSFVFVSSGTINADTGWVQTGDVTTVGTSAITFTQFSGSGTYTAGTGLTLTGTQFSVNALQPQITQVGVLSNLQVSTTATASQFVSNVATGTAPLVVSSTTLVTNLNANLLQGRTTSSGRGANTIVNRDASGAFATCAMRSANITFENTLTGEGNANAVIGGNLSANNITYGGSITGTGVRIGDNAGLTNQGTNGVAIGLGAGTTNQGNNSIIINATGSNLENITANSFVVKPIRNDANATSVALYYDSTTGEITYANSGGGSANVVSIPPIYFTAPIDGNNQNFSNSFLESYTSNADITLFYNGALLENTLYTLAGDTLTVNTYLRAGDTVDIVRQFAGNVNNITSTYGNTEVTAYLEAGVAGNIIPATTLLYDLGNATHRWNDLYLSGNSIFIGNVDISTDGNSLLIGGNRAITEGIDGNIEAIGSINANGNITSNATITANSMVAALFTGDGGGLSNLSIDVQPSVGNGTSTLNFPQQDGAATFTIGGLGNVVTVSTSGLITTTVTANTANIDGNVIANLVIANLIDVNGTIVADNANLGNSVTANFFVGDGSLLTGLPGISIIANGTSSVTIPAANGAIGMNVGNTANAMTVGETGVLISGNLAYTGTILANTIRVGFRAGNTSQGSCAVAVGVGAGANTQGAFAIAIGANAGGNIQSANSISIGTDTGALQLDNAIAIGAGAGSNTQGVNSIAIGAGSGVEQQGGNSIAIGLGAGATNQAVNSIVINATGANLENTTANSLVISPIRSATGTTIAQYNPATGEVTQSCSINTAGGICASCFVVPTGGSAATVVFNAGGKTIANVNALRIQDPGPGEGIIWDNGSGWQIYETPNDLTNNAGNLQIVLADTRVASFQTNGELDVPVGITTANVEANTVAANSATVDGVITANTFTSTVAVGTAPFTVTSTTQVDNLNANLLQGRFTTSSRTAGAIVNRDASGAFSAVAVRAANLIFETTLTGEGNANAVIGGNVSANNITANTVTGTQQLIATGLTIIQPNYIDVSAAGTYQLSNTISTNILINTDSGTPLLTINMPVSPVDGQLTEFNVVGNVANLAVGTGTVVPSFAGVPTLESIGFQYVYRQSTDSWYRVK